MAEVDKVSNGLKVVLVLALQRSGASAVLNDVGKKLSVANFLLVSLIRTGLSLVGTYLVGHELDQRDVLGAKTGLSKLLFGESRDTVVEEIELDPFLVQTDDERLVVDCEISVRSSERLCTLYSQSDMTA